MKKNLACGSLAHCKPCMCKADSGLGLHLLLLPQTGKRLIELGSELFTIAVVFFKPTTEHGLVKCLCSLLLFYYTGRVDIKENSNKAHAE